jgi:hypothetical protein
MDTLLCCFFLDCACDLNFFLWLKEELKASELTHLLEVQVTLKIAVWNAHKNLSSHC